jgi:hypothetical protein
MLVRINPVLPYSTVYEDCMPFELANSLRPRGLKRYRRRLYVNISPVASLSHDRGMSHTLIESRHSGVDLRRHV